MDPTECRLRREFGGVAAYGGQDHVILIEDARLFGADPNYPRLDEFGYTCRHYRPHYGSEISHDSIRVTPRY